MFRNFMNYIRARRQRRQRIKDDQRKRREDGWKAVAKELSAYIDYERDYPTNHY